MNERRGRGEALAASAVIAVVVVASLLASGRGNWRQGPVSNLLSASTSVAAAERSAWRLAAQKVTEDRGEATGRQAQVEVPGQLKHYSDRRRFLAIQVAEWREHTVGTPRDYAGLARMIRRGELVEVAPVTDSYVLFGVGARADGEPFTLYDKAARRSVPLLDDAALAQERARLTASAAGLQSEVDALRRELDALGKKERARRASLRAQVAKKEAALKAERGRAVLLDSYYGSTERRRALTDERADIAALARDFYGPAYDINDTAARRELKVRMLSHLRPEALAVMQELAKSYYEQFQRPLPITSLVRPDEYQQELSKTNANATRIDTPPHSTGLAFDILYRYMTAAEQEYLMADIARLRDAGRVESLRENRDHIHVFAFIDGQRPDEGSIRASLAQASAPAARDMAHAPARSDKKSRKAATKKADGKKTAKRASSTASRNKSASARHRKR